MSFGEFICQVSRMLFCDEGDYFLILQETFGCNILLIYPGQSCKNGHRERPLKRKEASYWSDKEIDGG
jgi:hypothetical protein